MASPTPQGPVVPLGIPDTQDYPRLVFAAPYFTTVAIADIIEPSVLEAVEGMLPSLVPPYVQDAANQAVQQLAVLLTGSTMTGPLYLNGLPTQPTQAADKQYVDMMVATGNVPEVPPVPNGQTWARQTGQWVPLAGGGSVSNITTGAGLTGGPITTTGTISMANMNGNTLKGNNTGTVTAPTDLNVGQVMTMLGAAPLNSPNFVGTPTLPTGTQAITQPGGTNNTSVATTAFVAASSALALPLAGGTMTGAIVLAGNAAANLNPVPLQQLTSVVGAYVPLAGGTMTGQLTVRPGVLIGNAAPAPPLGALTLNANAAAPQSVAALGRATQLWLAGADTTSPDALIDAYGTPTGALTFRKARGTAAAPTPAQSGDTLGLVEFYGRGTSTYGANYNAGAAVRVNATENLTETAQGSALFLQTTPVGTAATVNSLILQGNTASFSGTVSIPSNLSLYFNGLNSGAAGRIVGDGSNLIFNLPGSGTYSFQNAAGAAAMICDASGNLTIEGATAVKPGGGSWTAPSDPGLKTNVGEYTGGLQAVLALNPITYEYSEGAHGLPTGTAYIGLDAEATLVVMPELVGSISLPIGDEAAQDYLTIDSGPLIYALVNAVKELAARVEALE
jgi:hypothetical protein